MFHFSPPCCRNECCCRCSLPHCCPSSTDCAPCTCDANIFQSNRTGTVEEKRKKRSTKQTETKKSQKETQTQVAHKQTRCYAFQFNMKTQRHLFRLRSATTTSIQRNEPAEANCWSFGGGGGQNRASATVRSLRPASDERRKPKTSFKHVSAAVPKPNEPPSIISYFLPNYANASTSLSAAQQRHDCDARCSKKQQTRNKSRATDKSLLHPPVAFPNTCTRREDKKKKKRCVFCTHSV